LALLILNYLVVTTSSVIFIFYLFIYLQFNSGSHLISLYFTYFGTLAVSLFDSWKFSL